LVADDNRHDVRFLEEGLRSTDLDFRLEHVLDGDEALAILTRDCLQGNPPDLFVLDVYLPRKDGDEVLRAVRGAPAECKLRILILTGELPEGEARRLMELGASEVMPKPSDLAGYLILGAKIRDMCNAERGRRFAAESGN
jgi:CheY-like chemotaxis protein